MTTTALDAALAALTPAQLKALRTSPPERKISAIKDLRKAMEDAGIKVTATEAKDMLEQLQHAGNGKTPAPATSQPTPSGAADELHSAIADLLQLGCVLDLASKGLTGQQGAPPSDDAWNASHLLDLASDRICDVCDRLNGLRDRLTPEGAA